VALHQAFAGMRAKGLISKVPLNGSVAAISCGVYNGHAVLDLDYAEDSTAQADANFVLSGAGGIIEIQGTAEQDPFSEEQFHEMYTLAKQGVVELTALQRQVLGITA
jgi:ribonuclease PH